MTTLVAYQIDSGRGDPYWEIYSNDNPHDPAVTTVEGEDFGDYVADLLTSGYVEDILVNTYESWLVEQELMDHKEYL